MLLSEVPIYINIIFGIVGIVFWILFINDLSKKWKSTCLLIVVVLGIIIISTHIDQGTEKIIDSIKASEKRLIASQDSILKNYLSRNSEDRIPE